MTHRLRFAFGITLITIGISGTAAAKNEPLLRAETLEILGAKVQQAGRFRRLTRDNSRMWNAIRATLPQLTERSWADMPKHHVYKDNHEYIRAGWYGDGKQLQMEYKGTNGTKRVVMNFGDSVNRSTSYNWSNGKGMWKLETSHRGVEYFAHDRNKSPKKISAAEAHKILRHNGSIKRAAPASATWRQVKQTRLRLNRLVPRIMASTLMHRARHGKSTVNPTPRLYRK